MSLYALQFENNFLHYLREEFQVVLTVLCLFDFFFLQKFFYTISKMFKVPVY